MDFPFFKNYSLIGNKQEGHMVISVSKDVFFCEILLEYFWTLPLLKISLYLCA